MSSERISRRRLLALLSLTLAPALVSCLPATNPPASSSPISAASPPASTVSSPAASTVATPTLALSPSVKESPLLLRQGRLGPAAGQTEAKAMGNVEHLRLSSGEDRLRLAPDFALSADAPAEIVLTQSAAFSLAAVEQGHRLGALRASQGAQEYALLASLDFAGVALRTVATKEVFGFASLPSKPACQKVPAESDLIGADPAEVPDACLPLSNPALFGVTSRPPEIDMSRYGLLVNGEVEHPQGFSLADLAALPQFSLIKLLICPAVFADAGEFTGVPLSIILDRVQPKPTAHSIRVRAVSGYDRQFTMDEARGGGMLLALTINGGPLPEEHGYPLRLVAPGLVGSAWVKWVSMIQVLPEAK